MSLPLSPYLSQILTKLLETLTGLRRIKISIHICNLREVILLLFGTINFTTKNRSQPVWTSFFQVVDWLGLVIKGPVVVPKYLKWSRPVGVASCLVLGEKTGLNWTWKHYFWCISNLVLPISVIDSFRGCQFSHNTTIVALSLSFLYVLKLCCLVLFSLRKMQKTKKAALRKFSYVISSQWEHLGA